MLWFPPFAILLLFVCSLQWPLADILDDYLVEFSTANENENTVKKTEYDVRIFREYLDTIQERRDITQMPFPNLQKILMKSRKNALLKKNK